MNIRQLKDMYKWGLRKAFVLGQHLGFDILPRHFYSEIPDVRALRKDQSWKAPPAQFWYYCDESKAYYPYVATCNGPWRQVSAVPPPSGR